MSLIAIKVVSRETGMPINLRKEGNPLVGIVGGSTSDFPILKKAVDLLEELGVESELRVVSAHRTPDWLFEYAEEAEDRGLKVIIAGAGGAAGIRTPDPLLAKQVLSRLSYSPTVSCLEWHATG